MGLTWQGFVRAAAGGLIYTAPTSVRTGSTAGALEAYRAFYREGPTTLARIEVRDGFDAPWADPARAADFLPTIVRVLREPSLEGTVIKFLSRIPALATGIDGTGNLTTLAPSAAALTDKLTHLEIESVLIPMIGSNGVSKYTLCVSSQVGCAMGCTFCETAQMGLIRSLLPQEIVGQWFAAKHLLARDEETERQRDELKTSVPPPPTSSLRLSVSPSLPPPITNIVFMGMGEPMDNLPNVIAAVDVLKDTNACNLAVSRITISTVGRVDGIRALAAKIREPGWHRLGIALSLNAPNDDARSKIMPVNRKYNLAAVQQALMDWPEYAGNKICVEYVLIPGENDTREHAQQIAEFIRPFGLHKTATNGATNQGLRAVLNLIPYNPRRNSPWPAPTEEQVEQFMSWLTEEGVFVKRRRTKGRRMMGACGQLGTEQIRRRQLVTPTVSIPR
jgi:23S rRNA (adenine2503-C2)-methyltransferase